MKEMIKTEGGGAGEREKEREIECECVMNPVVCCLTKRKY